MYRVALIAVGGGGGSVLREFTQGWVQRLSGGSFLGTLIVNISGCLVIGFLGGLFFGPWPIDEDYRFAILTGVLGGFTTFSSFGWETMKLSDDGEFLYAGLNVALSVFVGLVAGWLGKQLVQAMYGT